MPTINTGLNAYRPLLPSEPAQRATTPAEQATTQRLNDIRQLLSDQNIDTMMRSPESPAVAELLSRLRNLTNTVPPGNLQRGSHPDDTKALGAIGTLLSKSAINQRMSDSLSAYVKTEAKKYEMTHFENLLQLSLADPEAAWDTAMGIWSGLQASILASQAFAGHIRTNANTLKDLGERFNSDSGK